MIFLPQDVHHQPQDLPTRPGPRGSQERGREESRSGKPLSVLFLCPTHKGWGLDHRRDYQAATILPSHPPSPRHRSEGKESERCHVGTVISSASCRQVEGMQPGSGSPGFEALMVPDSHICGPDGQQSEGCARRGWAAGGSQQGHRSSLPLVSQQTVFSTTQLANK